MNTKVLFSVLLSIGLLMAACKKDESPAKPVVTIHELGQGDTHGNDNQATIGGSLHMDVEIVAEGKIDYIQVKLHHEEDGHDHKSAKEDEWELDLTFTGTGISGLKNLDFHKDLAIDASAEPGDYHFDVIVVDLEGNSGSAEAEVELLAPSKTN